MKQITYCIGVNTIGQPMYITHFITRYKAKGGTNKLDVTCSKEYTE